MPLLTKESVQLPIQIFFGWFDVTWIKARISLDPKIQYHKLRETYGVVQNCKEKDTIWFDFVGFPVSNSHKQENELKYLTWVINLLIYAMAYDKRLLTSNNPTISLYSE